MKRGKYQTSPKGVSSKAVALVLALVLTIGCVVGGTIAWLTDKTEEVKNTFTYGDINIDLTETTGNTYKIVPGVDLDKDPKVTVEANSEACWLFVKVDEVNWPTFTEIDGTTKKVAYAIADGWTALEGYTGVYYREVPTKADAQEFAVLANNKVIVSENLTKTEIDAVTTNPTLTFTAYAVQKAEVTSATAAWAIANPTT